MSDELNTIEPEFAEEVPEFLQAMFPPTYVVCGITLKPFCYSHYCILKANQNPFVSDRLEKSDVGSLLFLVAICSRTHEEAMEFLRNKEESEKWMEWFATEYIKQHEQQNLVPDFDEEMRSAQLYIKEHIKKPLYCIERESTAIQSGVSPIQATILELMGLGFTHSEVMNMPYGLATYNFAYIGEKNGAIRFLNDDEKAVVKMAEGKG